MPNGTKAGLGTYIGLIMVGIFGALFVWRLSSGDTPDESSAYILLILGAVSGLFTQGLRFWQNVMLEIGRRGEAAQEDPVE